MKKITKAILSFALTAVMSIGIASSAMAAQVGAVDAALDGGFTLNGIAYKASEKWKTDGTTVPEGFKEYTLHIGTHTYSELKDASGIILVYLKPADNTAGKGTFYVFDEGSGAVSTFNYLNGVLVGTPDYVPSSVLNATTLEVGASQYEAFQLTGSNFYYFYGTDASGLPDWFSYDPSTGNVAKADAVALAMTEPTVITETVEAPPAVEATPDNSANYAAVEVYIEKLSSLRKVIIFLIIVILVLLFIIVNLLLSNFAASREGDVFKENKGGAAKAPARNGQKPAPHRNPSTAKPAARPAAPERQSVGADGPKIHKASEKRRNDVFPEEVRKPAPAPAGFGQPGQPQAPVYPNMANNQNVYQNQFGQGMPVQQGVDPELAPIDISGMAGAPKYNGAYAPNMQPGQPSMNDVYGGVPQQPQVPQNQGNGVIDFNNL